MSAPPRSPLLWVFAVASLVAAEDGACSMTDTGKGNLWKVEMYSINPSQPYKAIHCRFQGNDKLVSFTGSDSTGQCDHCVRSSGFSATCGCTCPGVAGGNCTWTFYGQFQFDPAGNATKSCTCNGRPGPPIPPAPPPAPPKPPPPPGPAPPCKAKLDVVIVLDGSASIIHSDWRKDLAFANQLVDAFNVSADQVKVAAVQFSSRARTIIDLSSDAAVIKLAIVAERQMALETDTYDGFLQAKDILDTHGRPSAKGKLVFLVTDGRQDRGVPAKGASVALQRDGAEIFGIGVGHGVDEPELQSWVSSPVSEHYFKVSAFADLDKILKKVIANACPHPPE